jgi:hypothetical protein
MTTDHGVGVAGLALMTEAALSAMEEIPVAKLHIGSKACSVCGAATAKHFDVWIAHCSSFLDRLEAISDWTITAGFVG